MNIHVKELEWNEDRDDDGTEIHRTRGGSVNLPYAIYEDGFTKKPFGLSLNQLRLGSFDTADEAKAAAQADFEQRIRSALAIPAERPAGGGGVEDSEALKAASIEYWNHGGRALSETSPDRLQAACRAYAAALRPSPALPAAGELSDEAIDAAIREWMSGDDRTADGFRVRMRAAIRAALRNDGGE